MKLTAFIILVACVHVNAKTFSQTVTFTKNNVSLVSVFEEIQKQTGYNFLYTYEDLEAVGKVNVSLQNASLNEALNSCLKNLPLTWGIVERTIVIQRTVAATIPEADNISDTTIVEYSWTCS